MSREQFNVGELTVRGVSNGAVTVLERNASRLVARCKCATGSIPSAVAGYAVGCKLIDTTTGHLYSNQGSVTSCTFNDLGAIAGDELNANVVTPIKMGTRAVVALADSPATPTIAQLMTSSIFTMTTTAARTFTTPTAALMVAGITGATIGTWFDFAIINAAAFAVTVTAGSDVTIVGNAVVNKGSAIFRVVLTSLTAVSIYRLNSAAVTENLPLENGKYLVGDANGLAAAKTVTNANGTATNQTTVATNQTTVATNQTTVASNQTTVATNQAATATNQNATSTRLVSLGTAGAVDLDGVVTVVNLANGVQAIAAQPDVPRSMRITVVDTTPGITVGTVTIDGTDALDAVIQEVVDCAAGAGTYNTVRAFKTVTAVTTADFATLGGAGDETIKVGNGEKLGVALDVTDTAGVAYADGVAEAVTINATYNTAIPTTALGGVLFQVLVNANHNHTQDSHNHTQDTHNHTQDTHNHTQDTHNHTQDTHNHTQDTHTHSLSVA